MTSSPVIANDLGSNTKVEAFKKVAKLGCVGAYEWEGSGCLVKRTMKGPMTTIAVMI